MSGRVCLVAAAAVAVAHGRFLDQMPGDGLGAGPSAIIETLRAAQDRATGHVWQGVSRVEDLESQNADLWRQNKELERRAAAASEEVEQLEGSSAAKERERVLEQELLDLKSKRAALEADKAALATSMEKIMNTSDTAALNKRLAYANDAKLEDESAMVKEQLNLKSQLLNATQKLKAASEGAEDLQQDNFEMHKAGEVLQGQIEDSRSQISSMRAQNEHLEDSMKGISKIAAAKEHADLLSDESDLRQKVKDAQENVQRLQRKLKDAKRELESNADTSQRDGGAQILQTLQDENLDLRRESDASRSEAAALTGKISSLQYDKEHLIVAMQSSMREADKLRQLLKSTIAEKDEEIAAKDKRLLEGAQQLASIKAQAASRQMRPAVAHRANMSTAPQADALPAAAKPTAQPQAPAADPILSMHIHVEEERRERERMQAFARAAVAATGDESLAFGPVADTEPVAAAEKSVPQLHISSRAPQAQGLSPVDALDPEAVAKERRAAKADEDAVQGDSIDQLLTQAQAAVDRPLAAAQ